MQRWASSKGRSRTAIAVAASVAVAMFVFASPAQAATICECGSCSCGGGGGNLATQLIAQSPSSASGQTACAASEYAAECPGGDASYLTEPLGNSASSLYDTSFVLVPTGGSGTYTYGWDFGSWAPGGESVSHEFTQIATYTVLASVSGDGTVGPTGNVEIQISVEVTMGNCPSSCNGYISEGGLGWGLSLNQPATKFAINVMAGGGVAATVAGLVCVVADATNPFPAGITCELVTGVVAGLLLLYTTWAGDANQGNGVCFESDGDVVANPCSSEF